MIKLIRLLLYLSILSLVSGPLISLPIGIPALNVYISDLCVLSVTLLWIINYRELFNLIKKDKISQLMTIFVFIAFLSWVFSPITLTLNERLISFLYIVRFVSYFSIYVTLKYLIKKRSLKPKDLIKLLAVSGFLLAIIGWVQYFLYPDLRNLYYLGWDPHYKRIFSTILDSNYLGLLMGLTLIILILSFKPSPIIWFGRFIIFITLMFTYSRSSYLSLITGVLFITIMGRKYLILGVLLLAIIISIFILPRSGGESVRLERVFSVTERINNWRDGITIIFKYPVLGIGFNTVRYAKKEFEILQDNSPVSHSGAGFDNSFIYVAVTTGLIGLIVYLLLLKQIYSASGILGKASLIVIITHSLFLNSLFLPWVMIWMWVVIKV